MDCPNTANETAQDARSICSKENLSNNIFPSLFQKENVDSASNFESRQQGLAGQMAADLLPGQGEQFAADKRKRSGVLDRFPVSDLQKSIDTFEEKHKINISNSNGTLTYSLDAHGRRGVLFKTDASEYGLREAEFKLNSLVSARQKQIEQRYAVKFATPGDIVDHQRPTEDSQTRSHLVFAVQPELYQVEGLLSGLEKSGPTSFAVGAHDMKIYFLSDKAVLDKAGHASYQNDRAGVPSIYFFPSINEVSKATEADLLNADRRKPHSDKSRPETIEGVVMHQMGHHQFVKMGYQNSVDGEIFQSNIGWLRNRDWNSYRTQWLLLGKDTDSDGTNSSYIPSIDATTGATTWIRTKPDGGGVDSRGRKVPIVQAERLSSEQIRDRALIKPPTLNFNSPEDEYAESVRMHRLSESSRRDLIRSSPFIYDQVKANDQKEIDDKYGKKTDGTSKYLRAPNGHLVDNDDVNRMQVQSFEILSMYPDLKMKIDGVPQKRP